MVGWALNTKEDRPARLHERKASLLWVGPFMTVERKWVFALRDMRSHDGFELTWSDLCFQKVICGC